MAPGYLYTITAFTLPSTSSLTMDPPSSTPSSPPHTVILPPDASPTPSSPPPPRARPSQLLSTLSRLSLSKSRPDLPDPPTFASRLRSLSGSPLSLFVTSPSEPADTSASLLPADLTATLYPTLSTAGTGAGAGAHPVLVLDLAAARHVRGASDDELFDGVLRRLEPWVGEEGEGGYVLVVLAGGSGAGASAEGGEDEGHKGRALPNVPWWIWKYRRIPRKYRKNLKKLFIVHPSTFTKAALPLLLPIISPKSYPKLHIAPSLSALGSHLPLRGIDITPALLLEEARAVRTRRAATLSALPPTLAGTAAEPRAWAYATISGALASASSYLRAPQVAVVDPLELGARGLHGGRVSDLAPGGHVVGVLVELARVILNDCAGIEGIFRRSCSPHYLAATLSILSLPQEQQPTFPLAELTAIDPLLPPALVKRLLADLEQPVIPADLYPLIRLTSTVEDLRQLLETLPSPTHAVLAHVVHLAHHLVPHEPATKMSASALAIVLAPTLISSDPLADAAMCLEPGKALPSALRGLAASAGGVEASAGGVGKAGGGEAGAEGSQTLVGLLALWITNYAEVEGTHGPCGCPWGRGEVEVVRREKGARRHDLLGARGKRASVASVAIGT
ncbi:hypothetical protein Q5752_004927 [Cryptotrichosporon argae]